MSLCRNTYLVVKRRLCLQTIWRHPFFLAAEISFVLVSFGFVLKYDHVDPANVQKLNKDQNVTPAIEDPRLDKHFADRRRMLIVYGPNSSYSNELVTSMADQFLYNRYVDSSFWEYHAVDTPDEVVEACRDEVRGEHEPRSASELLCVQFWNQDVSRRLESNMLWRRPASSVYTGPVNSAEASADNTSLSYTLVYHLRLDMLPLIDAPLDAVSYLRYYDDYRARTGAYFRAPRHLVDKLLAAQEMIDGTHLKLQSKDRSVEYKVLYRKMPMIPPFLDVKAYRNGLFYALSIAFCLPLIFRIGDVNKEMSSRLMEQQRLMGLSGLQFWLGHFISALTVGVVEGGLVLCVVYFRTKDFPAPQETTTYPYVKSALDYYGHHNLEPPAFINQTSELLAARGIPYPDYDYKGNEEKEEEEKKEREEKKEKEEKAHLERVNRDFLDVPYMDHVDLSLVVAALFTFHVSHALLGLLVACVMPLGHWAVLLGFGVFLALPSYDRASFNFFEPTPLTGYLIEDRITKLRRCIYPNAGLDTLIKIIGIFSDFELDGGWSVIERHALGCDNVTILEVWAVMGATALVAIVQLWYLSQVLPWSSASPQNPLFPLLPWYWIPWRVTLNKDTTRAPLDDKRFEKPPDKPIVIECRQLKKYFGNFAALNGVDMTIHEDQVTVLLGHNGAGKTTLFNILTGLYTRSGGSLTVGGWDVRTDAARGMVGYCPQVDVFFDDLTVEEHLVYYAGLRGVPDRVTQAQRQMKSLKLTDKADNFPGQLSGGYQRKLSVAIALVSSPKLLILDEPTSGMDPEMRQSFWKIVHSLRGKVTVLLSTHDMEEADAVGDRIIVMHRGRVICSGSTSFLKDACGVGYKLTLGKAAAGFNLAYTLALVRNTVPFATVEMERDNDVTFALHTFNCDGFEGLFRQLEYGAARMGITAISVTVATMKDAYVKIHTEWASEVTQKKLAAKEAAEATAQSTTPSSLSPHCCTQFVALLGKRCAYLSRTKMLFLTGWLLPVAVAVLTGIVLERQQEYHVSNTTMVRIPIGAQALYGPGVHAFMRQVDPTNFSVNYEALLESKNISVDQLGDPETELLEMLKENFLVYGPRYVMGGVFNDTEMEAWYNPISLFSIPVVNNLAHTALLRTYSGKPRSTITTDVALYVFSEEDLAEKNLGLVYPSVLNDQTEQRLRHLQRFVLQNWLYWGCIVTISVGMTLSSFVVFPAAEVHNGARGLQLMTGVPGCMYLMAHFLFDLVFYLVPMGAIYGTIIYLQQLALQTTLSLVTIVFTFAPIGILLPYLVTDRIESENTAHSVIVGVFAIGGPAAFLLFILLAITTRSAGPRVPLLFIPPFALGAATIRAINLELEAEMCELMRLQESWDTKINTQFCKEISPFGSGIIHCCKMLLIDPKERGEWDVTTPFSFNWYSILLDLAIMLVLAIPVFCCVISKLESAYGGEPKVRDLHTHVLDDDVDQEKELVNQLCRRKKFPEHVMLVRNLHKFYGDFYAVRGVYLALRPGECFGLVGINGAGKTTTFQMLAGLEEMTDGNAYMESLILSKQPRKWQSFIGYCPQSDALLGKLNAYETLRLFGRLRGVPSTELGPMIEQLIKVVDLEEQASKLCEHYSGGQKRKLCIAVALMGFPSVVFLDEPYAGVDVISRNNMRETMNELKESTNTSIVLTSHNMAECELSCDRIGIMVKGQMTCIGTLQHLKTKFGKGITIQFVVPLGSEVNPADLNKAVSAAISGAKQLDAENRLEYFLDQRPAWSALFGRVSALQKEFQFEHVIVTDTNLEELFLGFAKKAREDAELEIKD